MGNAVMTDVMTGMRVKKVQQAPTNFSTTPSAKRNGKNESN
ncbi:hypothetical protein VCHE16_1224 [Vibrio paracholerae HE-16]|nr:hypothetical protein VCHE09_1693 [Vibrio paracholerae HE-09]EKG88268.1 hypothetical protein VCHE16_1224 [Vibrio paracholerae HE-16]EMP93471.1 hypothetical protein VC87395_001100 [Vibrio paracholerae 87395]